MNEDDQRPITRTDLDRAVASIATSISEQLGELRTEITTRFDRLERRTERV